MEYLTVGKIYKTVGLKGELRIFPTTSFSLERFKKGSKLYVEDEGIYKELTIKSSREKDKFLIVGFNEISTIEEAEKYLGKFLYGTKDYKLLENDEYFYDDLLKCAVYFDNGEFLGTVMKIEEYGPYATLRVKQEGKKDVLIPFVESYLKEVNIKEKKIIINFIEGLR